MRETALFSFVGKIFNNTHRLVIAILTVFTLSFISSPVFAQSTVKIMTFNVLGPNECWPHDHTADMQQITNLIRNNAIKIAALQEVISRGDGCHDYDMPGILRNQLPGNYSIYARNYIKLPSNDDDTRDRDWWRLFIHDSPAVSYHKTSPDIDPAHSQGAESVVLDTTVGRIRFINIHPQPGTQALNLDKMLVPYITQFKGDGIPIIIMGDFNLNFAEPNAEPVLNRIIGDSSYPDGKGFYRACDPAKFPNGNCNDTVMGSSNFAVDHIFIDKRASFFVNNAYVEQSMQFSDHLPVVVELVSQPPPTPTPINFIPNCWNLTGPTSIHVGSSGTYSANVSSPGTLGDLTGEISRDSLVTIKQTRFPTSNTGTVTGAVWTPTVADIGAHIVYCRAWNDGIAECRPANLVDRPPRYACAGPTTSIIVQVLPAYTPTPTRTPTPTSTPTRTPTPTPTPNQLPIGVVGPSNVCAPISGWTCDPSSFSSALQVNFLVNGSLLTSTTANSSRSDSAASCGGTSNHGFSLPIPLSLKNNKNVAVTVQAINIPVGTNPQLSGSPYTFTCYSADENSNGVIEFAEWREMFREFYKPAPNATFQANTDSIINAIDFGIVRRGL